MSDVSVEIPPGEVTALLGPNGAGKSTLVLAVAGVLRTSAGRVLLGDQDLTRHRPEHVRGAGVAVVAEGRRLLPELTVEDNLRVATYSLSRDEADAASPTRSSCSPSSRSAGMSRDVCSRAASSRWSCSRRRSSRIPAILLVDELSLGLAPVVVKRLVPTLEAVAASGVGVFLIEQFAHVALGLAKTAYVLEGGRIRYHGTAQELTDNPELLHSAYLLRERVRDAIIDTTDEDAS